MPSFRAALPAAFVLLLLLPSVAQAQGASTFNGLTVLPSTSSVAMGRDNFVLVELRHAETGAVAPGREVRLCGASLNASFPVHPPDTLTSSYRDACPTIATTGSDGTATLVVTPTSTYDVFLYIDQAYAQRSFTVTVGPLSHVVSPEAPTTSDAITVRVLLPGGSSAANAWVKVWRDTTYYAYDRPTDAFGEIVLSGLQEGTYFVRASRSGYEDTAGSFVVSAPRAPLMSLVAFQVPSKVDVGRIVTAAVDVKNSGTASGQANVQLLINGAVRDARIETLAVGEQRSLAFEFTPTVAGTYAVVVRVDGLSSAPSTLVVEVPRPAFALQTITFPSRVTVGTPFSVSVEVANPDRFGGNVDLRLEVDGAQVESRSVWVDALTTQSVAFHPQVATVGEHTLRVWTEGSNLSATLRTVQEDARFTLRDLKSPSSGTIGVPVEVSATLANGGTTSGSFVAVLSVNGATRDTITRTLGAGESERLVFDPITFTAPGTYRLAVRGATTSVGPAEIVITAAAPTPLRATPTTVARAGRVALEAENGSALAGASAYVLAPSGGALAPRRTVSADARGEIPVDAAGASHIALPHRGGVSVVPLPRDGRLVVPSEVARATKDLTAEERAEIGRTFRDARVLDLGASSTGARRVSVLYAGLNAVSIESGERDAKLVVARYSDRPVGIVPAPPGTAHQWLGLHLIRADGTDAPFTSATVHFARPEATDGRRVVLYHYDGTAWTTVEPVEGEDKLLSATVSSFSIFAVGSEPVGALRSAWIVPLVAVLGALTLAGAVVVPRLARSRRASREAAAAPPAPPEPAPAMVEPPAPPAAPVTPRIALPRRPLRGDVVVSGLGVRTGGKTFLEDVSFRIPRGTFSALVGPPGSGKAMTLLALLGEAPIVGEVHVGDMRPGMDKADLRRAVGTAAGAARLEGSRTIEQLFDAVADRRELPLIETRLRGARILRSLGARCGPETRGDELSPLDQRRVLVAAALLHDPELLLLDEPGLDLPEEERRALWDDLRRLREELGLTVLATTQHAADAAACDGVVLMEGGRVVASGAPAAVLR